MGILGCGLCPHGRSRRRRWIPAQPLLHYKPVGSVVWYSRSGQVLSLQCRGAGSALTGRSLLRRCSVELQLRAPATCRVGDISSKEGTLAIGIANAVASSAGERASSGRCCAAGCGQRKAHAEASDTSCLTGATSEWMESCRPTEAQLESMADAPEPRRMLAAELGIGSGAMEESVPGEAGNGKRRTAMEVFSTGSPNCRWSTRLATPLVMLSRKSLTNNGTTKRSKQAGAGQAREVAGGRMLAGQWTRGGGARAEACPPPGPSTRGGSPCSFILQALRRQAAVDVQAHCQISRTLGAAAKASSQRRHPPSRRATSGHGPEVSATWDVCHLGCLPPGTASLLLGLDRSMRCGCHDNRGHVEQPPRPLIQCSLCLEPLG